MIQVSNNVGSHVLLALASFFPQSDSASQVKNADNREKEVVTRDRKSVTRPGLNGLFDQVFAKVESLDSTYLEKQKISVKTTEKGGKVISFSMGSSDVQSTELMVGKGSFGYVVQLLVLTKDSCLQHYAGDVGQNGKLMNFEQVEFDAQKKVTSDELQHAEATVSLGASVLRFRVGEGLKKKK
jgi:hypothetical protein